MIWCQDKLPQPIKTITALNAHLRKWQFVKMTKQFQLISHWLQHCHISLIVNNSLLTFIFQINCTYQNRNKIITESRFCTLFQQFPLCSGIPNSRLNSPVFASEHLGDWLSYFSRSKDWFLTRRKIKLKGGHLSGPICYKYSTENLTYLNNFTYILRQNTKIK